MMIRASMSLVAAILSALASVTVDAQDDTVVRVDDVAVVVQTDGTESLQFEGDALHRVGRALPARPDTRRRYPDIGVPPSPRRRPRLRESDAIETGRTRISSASASYGSASCRMDPGRNPRSPGPMFRPLESSIA